MSMNMAQRMIELVEGFNALVADDGEVIDITIDPTPENVRVLIDVEISPEMPDEEEVSLCDRFWAAGFYPNKRTTPIAYRRIDMSVLQFAADQNVTLTEEE